MKLAWILLANVRVDLFAARQASQKPDPLAQGLELPEMKPLTLALMGLEPQDAETFRDAFRQLPREQATKWRVLDDDSDAAADLTVVDIDSIYGHMDWLKATSAGSRTAVYTTAQNPQESDLVLGKPLRAGLFAEVLSRVFAELDGSAVAPVLPEAAAPAALASVDVEHAAVADEPLAEPTPEPASQQAAPVEDMGPRRTRPTTTRVEARRRPPVPAKPAPSPEPKTPVAAPVAMEAPSIAEPPPPAVANIGEWLCAGEFKGPRRIRAAGQEWILDPENDAFHGPNGLKPLVAALDDLPESAEPVDRATLEAARKQASQPLSRLRWVAGLHASPGQLLPALREARSYRLGRWPQIEREFPRHFRIATAMMKQAGDLDEIVAASGAPRAEVVDFINAYHTLGIVDVTVEQGAGDDPQRGGVMSRLRKPFGR